MCRLVKYPLRLVLILVLGLWHCFAPPPLASEQNRADSSEGIYTYGRPSRPDGTGKIYLGREIALPISGHGAIAWLERQSRQFELVARALYAATSQ